MAEQVTITPAMRADFDACMVVIVEEYREDFRGVIRAKTVDAAQWIANWRRELETNGSSGSTGREIQRRGI